MLVELNVEAAIDPPVIILIIDETIRNGGGCPDLIGSQRNDGQHHRYAPAIHMVPVLARSKWKEDESQGKTTVQSKAGVNRPKLELFEVLLLDLNHYQKHQVEPKSGPPQTRG